MNGLSTVVQQQAQATAGRMDLEETLAAAAHADQEARAAAEAEGALGPGRGCRRL